MQLHEIRQSLLVSFRERAKRDIEISYTENGIFRLCFFASTLDANVGTREYYSRNRIFCAFVCGSDYYSVRFHGIAHQPANMLIKRNAIQESLPRLVEDVTKVHFPIFFSSALEALMIPEEKHE
jgi:hypothetical protein